MIGVCLDGRLGNQLFQYAFVMAVAEKFKTFYIIDNDYKQDSVKKYFTINSFLNNKISRKLYKKFLFGRQPYIHQKGHEPVSTMLPLIKDNSYYKGFFQSELYFQQIQNSIKNKLRVRPVFEKAFAEKYGHLFKGEKVLAIHYRLSDYLTFGGADYGGIDLSLPETFYHNALQEIKNPGDYKILLVTDDVENAAHKLAGIKNKLIISDSEIMDFQLLMHADKLIISNSSFAWWGAYLNKKNADVYVPENWLGFKVGKELPDRIIPERFIKVNVN